MKHKIEGLEHQTLSLSDDDEDDQPSHTRSGTIHSVIISSKTLNTTNSNNGESIKSIYNSNGVNGMHSIGALRNIGGNLKSDHLDLLDLDDLGL